MSGPFVRAVTAATRDYIDAHWALDYLGNGNWEDRRRAVFNQSFDARYPEWREFHMASDRMHRGGICKSVKWDIQNEISV